MLGIPVGFALHVRMGSHGFWLCDVIAIVQFLLLSNTLKRFK
jgi:hypothetical protein